MNVARIAANGIVVNIEVAEPEWVAAQPDDGYTFVEYDDTNPAYIGGTYDPDTGTFAPPWTPDISVVLPIN